MIKYVLLFVPFLASGQCKTEFKFSQKASILTTKAISPGTFMFIITGDFSCIDKGDLLYFGYNADESLDTEVRSDFNCDGEATIVLNKPQIWNLIERPVKFIDVLSNKRKPIIIPKATYTKFKAYLQCIVDKM